MCSQHWDSFRLLHAAHPVSPRSLFRCPHLTFSRLDHSDGKLGEQLAPHLLKQGILQDGLEILRALPNTDGDIGGPACLAGRGLRLGNSSCSCGFCSALGLLLQASKGEKLETKIEYWARVAEVTDQWPKNVSVATSFFCEYDFASCEPWHCPQA